MTAPLVEDAADAPVGVAVAQFAPTADITANIAAIAALVERARARRADVVLLPEYASYFVDPFDETLAAHAEPVVGPFTEALRELAAVHDVVIVAGLLESASEGRVRNTVVAVGAQVDLIVTDAGRDRRIEDVGDGARSEQPGTVRAEPTAHLTKQSHDPRQIPIQRRLRRRV